MSIKHNTLLTTHWVVGRFSTHEIKNAIYSKVFIMSAISCSLFHFCYNHGPTVLLTTKISLGGSENLSLLLEISETGKRSAYQCSNCFSLNDETPYIVSNIDEDTYTVSGRSLFQSEEEASKVNHIGKFQWFEMWLSDQILSFFWLVCFLIRVFVIEYRNQASELWNSRWIWRHCLPR